MAGREVRATRGWEGGGNAAGRGGLAASAISWKNNAAREERGLAGVQPLLFMQAHLGGRAVTKPSQPVFLTEEFFFSVSPRLRGGNF